MFRGVLHVHSTYSDGEFSLPELRETLLRDGCTFACVTDHAEWFTGSSLARYLAECDELSDNRFAFIPGLEYECENRLHVLGYGFARLDRSRAPEQVIADIDAGGGVSVIAHPKTELFEWIESFERLPLGIEVWNSKYDGRYAPRPETFALLHRLRVRQPCLSAFYGQDLHWRRQYRGMQVAVECATNTRGAILPALAAGAFHGNRQGLQLPSSGVLSVQNMNEFARIHRRSQRLRHLMKATKDVADRLGVSVPAGVKSHLRRVF